MKKLKFFICFAAVLFLTTQFAVAQQPGFSDDPKSELKANSLRFNTDIDLYHSVNDWADIGVTKWFSFLQMGAVPAPASVTMGPNWEGGLALQMSKVYIAAYYNGQFNEGTDDQGTEYINVQTGESYKGFPAGSITKVNVGIERYNYFGIMAGVGGHGFKFSLLDRMTTRDVPIYVPNNGIGFPDPFDPGNPNAENAAEGAVGKYLYRNGRIMPKAQWGAAKDLTFGKYALRPNASFALDINFDEEEWYDLTDPDGNSHHFGTYNNPAQTLTPIVEFDTNGINFIPKAEWGNLVFGAIEEFRFTVQGENDLNGDHDQDSKVVEWRNRFRPYARFSYQPVSYFRLASRLLVPVNVGWNPSNQYWFGIGARGNGSGGTANDFPFLEAAFQLSLGFIDEISGKPSILERFKINWGIKVNLPGFVTLGTVVERTPNDELIDVTTTGKNQWLRSNPLQTFTAGITFNITDKALIDAGVDMTNWRTWSLTQPVTLTRVLISVKH